MLHGLFWPRKGIGDLEPRKVLIYGRNRDQCGLPSRSIAHGSKGCGGTPKSLGLSRRTAEAVPIQDLYREWRPAQQDEAFLCGVEALPRNRPRVATTYASSAACPERRIVNPIFLHSLTRAAESIIP
jgi:hypothetical protein